MKRALSFVCLILLVISISAICYSEQEREKMNNKYFEAYFLNDSAAIESVLANEYHLEDLIAYFGTGTHNKSIGYTNNTKELRITEVNQKFPVELVRESGYYSVYKVIEGGYYYIFWTAPVNKSIEPSVSFAAYLAGNRDSSLFDGLTNGVHTAQDVEAIDPSFELQYLMSSGIYSYSFLDEETLIQIKYKRDPQVSDYHSLLIENITLIKRNLAPSNYRMILSDDLPK